MYEINDIADIIDTANVASLGVNLFTYSAPADVADYVLLIPSADPPMIDPQTPFYFTGKFQTIVRTANYEAGIALCKALSQALTINNIETTNIKIKQVRPLYHARIYRRGEGGQIEMSISYKIHYISK